MRQSLRERHFSDGCGQTDWRSCSELGYEKRGQGRGRDLDSPPPQGLSDILDTAFYAVRHRGSWDGDQFCDGLLRSAFVEMKRDGNTEEFRQDLHGLVYKRLDVIPWRLSGLGLVHRVALFARRTSIPRA